MEVISNWIWQGWAVALSTAAVLRWLDRAPSQARCLVCWAGLSGVLLLPLMSAVPQTATPLPSLALSSPLVVPEVSSPGLDWAQLLLAMWGMWLLVHLGRVALAMRESRRVRARCASFPPELERRLHHWRRVSQGGRRARLVVSEDVRAAAVVGCGSPVIAVAPALIEQLTADELDRVVIHEWAHVQRRDDLTNLAQLLARSVAGFHPAVWWLDQRLQTERESACDEMTVMVTGSPKSYANCLVKLAGLVTSHREAVPALGVFSSSRLSTRIRRIVSYDGSTLPAMSRAAVLAAVVMLVVVSLAIGSIRLVEAAAESLAIDVSVTALESQPGELAAATRVPIARAPDVPSRSQSRAPRRIAAREPVTRPVETAAGPQIVIETPPEAPVQSQPTEPAPARAEQDTSDTASIPDAPLPARSIDIVQVQRERPWTAVANAGVSVAEQSKRGGLATAAFFTRFGKRVADSF